MHLIQILLPLNDNEGRQQEPDLFRVVASELTERFGGLTAHSRAPAEGLWKKDSLSTSRDNIVIFEVMAKELSEDWWQKTESDSKRDFGRKR